MACDKISCSSFHTVNSKFINGFGWELQNAAEKSATQCETMQKSAVFCVKFGLSPHAKHLTLKKKRIPLRFTEKLDCTKFLAIGNTND